MWKYLVKASSRSWQKHDKHLILSWDTRRVRQNWRGVRIIWWSIKSFRLLLHPKRCANFHISLYLSKIYVLNEHVNASWFHRPTYAFPRSYHAVFLTCSKRKSRICGCRRWGFIDIAFDFFFTVTTACQFPQFTPHD